VTSPIAHRQYFTGNAARFLEDFVPTSSTWNEINSLWGDNWRPLIDVLKALYSDNDLSEAFIQAKVRRAFVDIHI